MEIQCPYCEKAAWLLIEKAAPQYYKTADDMGEVASEPQEPAQLPKNAPTRQRPATAELEAQIRALLTENPMLTGSAIVARTGAKQSTVYGIVRKIKAEWEAELRDKHGKVPTAPLGIEMVMVEDLAAGLVPV